jgi:hypothetical protein
MILRRIGDAAATLACYTGRKSRMGWAAMTPDGLGYLSFLLRLWRAGDTDQPAWRASLENPLTGERQVFADLGALHAFLSDRTRKGLPCGEGAPDPEAAPADPAAPVCDAVDGAGEDDLS